LGDFIAQQAARRSNKAIAAEPYDVQRTMRLAFYGGCIAGPIGHNWFNFLDKVGICRLSLIYSEAVAFAHSTLQRILTELCAAAADGVSTRSYKVIDCLPLLP